MCVCVCVCVCLGLTHTFLFACSLACSLTACLSRPLLTAVFAPPLCCCVGHCRSQLLVRGGGNCGGGRKRESSARSSCRSGGRPYYTHWRRPRRSVGAPHDPRWRRSRCVCDVRWRRAHAQLLPPLLLQSARVVTLSILSNLICSLSLSRSCPLAGSTGWPGGWLAVARARLLRAARECPSLALLRRLLCGARTSFNCTACSAFCVPTSCTVPPNHSEQFCSRAHSGGGGGGYGGFRSARFLFAQAPPTTLPLSTSSRSRAFSLPPPSANHQRLQSEQSDSRARGMSKYDLTIVISLELGAHIASSGSRSTALLACLLAQMAKPLLRPAGTPLHFTVEQARAFESPRKGVHCAT